MYCWPLLKTAGCLSRFVTTHVQMFVLRKEKTESGFFATKIMPSSIFFQCNVCRDGYAGVNVSRACWPAQTPFTLVVPTGLEGGARCPLGLICGVLSYDTTVEAEPSFFRGGSLQPTGPEPSLDFWVLYFWKITPISKAKQSKAKAKRMDLCGLIFPCLWLHACMSRWWSQCGDGPVEVSCSVSLSLSWLWALWMGCKSESSGGRYPPEPPARRLMVPWPPPQSFLCRLAFSLAFLVF